jgi:transposase
VRIVYIRLLLADLIMGKKASLNETQRAQIVILCKEGQSERQISEKLSVSKTAVHQAIMKFKKSGLYCDQKRSGRPRKTTMRDDHLIRRIAVRSPMSSCKKIRSALLQKGTDVHRSTVSRRLTKEFGLKSHKPARKPLLTKTMKAKRLAFAKKYEHWDGHQWGEVLFTDESSIQQFGTRKCNVRRPIGTRFEERYTQATMKHPPSVMVWGAMSAKGTAGLFFLPKGTTMNGARYIEVLKEKLQLHMTVHNCNIFMQDGAPCHRSKIVQDYLKQEKIATLDWPGNSPDLNPIENLWNFLKDKVADRQPSNVKDLEKAIKDVWVRDISAEYCKGLVDSMPKRLLAVLDARGGHTKY